MPRAPKPIELHRIHGTLRPSRHAARVTGELAAESLGPPPRHLSAGSQAIWNEVAELAPWLRRADAQAVEVYVLLLAQLRETPDGMGGRQLALLAQQQRALGLQWAARQATRPDPVQQADDPDMEFFRLG